jgi:SSS family transporter
MSSTLLLGFVLAYFALLLIVAYFTSRSSNNDSFFIGNRNSSWALVAFGMIGTSLSGVTFVSVPGTVGAKGFQYFQVVIGYFIGYLVVAYVLMPLYYRLNLTSIYSYLEKRIGRMAYKTGSMFFIISRTLGATARLYLVVNILQIFILNDMGISFELTTISILLLILLYTFEGGVKTIVYTDTLQTTFMLVGLVSAIIAILSALNFGLGDAMAQMSSAGYTKLINSDAKDAGFFLKQIIGGAFITIAMTGLDQEMMQKNISVKNIGGAQKNMLTYSSVLLFVNLLFLILGGCLYLYATQNGLTEKGDDIFPAVALKHLSPAIGVLFVIGLISALFPSADGALTALTSSFCLDIYGLRRRDDLNEAQKKKIRLRIHLVFTVIFFVCVMVFKAIDDKSIIDVILKLAGYTYGPLLGLFMFGILTKRNIKDSFVLPIAIASPVIILVLDMINNADWFIKKLKLDGGLADTLTSMQGMFGGYKIGVELLVLNGLLTFTLLYLFGNNSKARVLVAEESSADVLQDFGH